jgi:hypothetical protein
MEIWLINLGKKGGVENFTSSAKRGVWGMNMKSTHVQGLRNKSQPGDLLVFSIPVEGGGGQIHYLYATAVLISASGKRVLGPLVALSASDEELGWVGGHKEGETKWELEVLIKDVKFMPPLAGTFVCPLLITVRRGSAPSLAEVNFAELLREIDAAQDAARVAAEADAARVAAELAAEADAARVVAELAAEADAARVAAELAAEADAARVAPIRRPLRDMKKCIRDGQRVRHKHTDEVWTATYNKGINKLVHAGVGYNSPSRFGKEHHMTNFNRMTKECSGWTDCELETAPDVWVKMHNLPEIVDE